MKHSKAALLDALYAPYHKKVECPFGTNRHVNIVLGEGNPSSPIVFIGEAPGEKEDELKRPFVGRSGQLLIKALELAGVPRERVFITNVVKCRPPQNRTPTHQEAAHWLPLLKSELAIIEPKVICTLGSFALNEITGTIQPITKVRGHQISLDHTILFPTYHPAYVLRNQTVLNTFVGDIFHAIQLAKKLKN